MSTKFDKIRQRKLSFFIEFLCENHERKYVDEARIQSCRQTCLWELLTYYFQFRVLNAGRERSIYVAIVFQRSRKQGFFVSSVTSLQLTGQHIQNAGEFDL